MFVFQGEEDDAPEALDMGWPSSPRKRLSYIVLAPILFPLWLTLPDTRTPRGKWVFINVVGGLVGGLVVGLTIRTTWIIRNRSLFFVINHERVTLYYRLPINGNGVSAGHTMVTTKDDIDTLISNRRLIVGFCSHSHSPVPSNRSLFIVTENCSTTSLRFNTCHR